MCVCVCVRVLVSIGALSFQNKAKALRLLRAKLYEKRRGIEINAQEGPPVKKADGNTRKI